MPTIRVPSSSGAYQVQCARGILARTGALIARLEDLSGVFVVSSPNVWVPWGGVLASRLRGLRRERVILIDDGDPGKNLSTVEAIARALHQAGADRSSAIVALGGGVVGDVAGFVAASYLRGVSYVQVPTTLVAQVDSAIGGKTGVNLPEGKNLIGAFYSPKIVIADPETLQTLPHRQYRSGLYEVIKYGIIADAELFGFLERHMLALLRRDPAALGWVMHSHQSECGSKGRARKRAARDFEFRPHAGPRAGSGHELPAISSRRGDWLGNAGGDANGISQRPAARAGSGANDAVDCERGAFARARWNSRHEFASDCGRRQEGARGPRTMGTSAPGGESGTWNRAALEAGRAHLRGIAGDGGEGKKLIFARRTS